MRHRTPIPVPYYRRTAVVSVEFDPDHLGQVIVIDTQNNRGSMTVAAFDATCRVVPGAVVCGIPVT